MNEKTKSIINWILAPLCILLFIVTVISVIAYLFNIIFGVNFFDIGALL